MKIINKTKNISIAENVEVADTFLSRMKGLLGRKAIKDGEGLIIKKCNSIHMMFMRFAIDAVFVDNKSRVVGLVKKIKPFRLSPFFWTAEFVIELPAGKIESTQTKEGDEISVE